MGSLGGTKVKNKTFIDANYPDDLLYQFLQTQSIFLALELKNKACKFQNQIFTSRERLKLAQC